MQVKGYTTRDGTVVAPYQRKAPTQTVPRSDIAPGSEGWLVIKYALAQVKLFLYPWSGLMHAVIFWGFLVVALRTLTLFVQGYSPAFHLPFLGPDDLLGCVLRSEFAGTGFVAITEVTKDGIVAEAKFQTFRALQYNRWEYHRLGEIEDGKPVWRRCEK